MDINTKIEVTPPVIRGKPRTVYAVDGLSAYQIAVKHGFEGTEEEWLNTIVRGDPGYTPVKGIDYFDGEDGEDGYTPVKGVDYFDGKDGNTPYIKDGNWWIGETDTGVKAEGKDGTNGENGGTFYNDAILFEEADPTLGKNYPIRPEQHPFIEFSNYKVGSIYSRQWNNGTTRKGTALLKYEGTENGYYSFTLISLIYDGNVVYGEGSGMTDDQVALLTKLSKWYDEEHYVAMTGTFSMSPGTTTYEMGSAQSVTFSWSFSKLPTEVKFNGATQNAAQAGSSRLTVTSQSHTTIKYALYGKYVEGETVSKELSINFRNKYYYGCEAIPTTIDSAFIKGLDKSGWASAKTISFTPDCTSGTYVWYAYPKRLGAATMWMGGFQGGFEEPVTVSVKNNSGYTEDYYVYRSTNSGIGDLSIQAK